MLQESKGLSLPKYIFIAFAIVVVIGYFFLPNQVAVQLSTFGGINTMQKLVYSILILVIGAICAFFAKEKRATIAVGIVFILNLVVLAVNLIK
ncbi:MAG: hypothetical protein ACRCTZ_11185 [Sarcina sp.]